MAGKIIWRGRSLLNGENIMLLLVHDSGNEKTGVMSQTYILRDDVQPKDAIKAHATAAICGTCPWQQNGCYAERSKGLISIGAKMSNGGYESIDLDIAAEQLEGRYLRLGAYGDPAAVPFEVWEKLCAAALGHTGYSHQWRYCDPRMAKFCMASVESAEDAEKAHALGWRTFRIRRVSETGSIEATQKGEVVCPASAERDLITCNDCRLCGGTSKRGASVAIIDHSTKALAVRRKSGDLLKVIQQ